MLDGVPRTVQFESADWYSGAPIETYTVSGVIATSSNGSRAIWGETTSHLFGFFTREKLKTHSIYNRPSHTAYIIDDDQRSVRIVPCTCTWERSPLPPQDDQCANVAKQYDEDLIYKGRDRVAGIAVVRYSYLNTYAAAEVAFAPTEHCEVLENFKFVFGVGAEKSYSRFRITKYIAGEPEANVFVPPGAYGFEKHR